MVDYLEQIKRFEEELRETPYNKRTQHHIGLVKAKIARLKQKHQARISSKKKGTGYSVRKTGDGTVIIVGYPSVGKSTLLNAILSRSDIFLPPIPLIILVISAWPDKLFCYPTLSSIDTIMCFSACQ